MTLRSDVGFLSIPKLKFYFDIITKMGKVWTLPPHLCMVISIFKNCIKDIGVW
jgi:hypothetical protein